MQVESETADAEVKLHNATQRLHRLEQDVTLLRDKAVNVSHSTEQTNQDAESIRKTTDEVQRVSLDQLVINSVSVCFGHHLCSSRMDSLFWTCLNSLTCSSNNIFVK